MKISFTIHFNTIVKQQLRIIGSIPELGNWGIEKAKKMTYSNNGFWHAKIDLIKKYTYLQYYYVIESEYWNFSRKQIFPHHVVIHSPNLS